jgi:hypothetical protein
MATSQAIEETSDDSASMLCFERGNVVLLAIAQALAGRIPSSFTPRAPWSGMRWPPPKCAASMFA